MKEDGLVDLGFKIGERRRIEASLSRISLGDNSGKVLLKKFIG